MSTAGSSAENKTQRAPFRVAVAQVAPALGKVAENLRLHCEQIDAARKAGADLLVFPELSLTGYYLRDQVPEVAEPSDGPLVRAMAEAAGSMAVVFGFVEESRDYRFYNTAAYVEAGALVATHRKVYLPTYGMFDEQRYFAAGNRVRAFETRFGRVGLLICEDAWHVSCGTILQADGIDLLIIPANSPGRGVREAELGSQQTWNLITRTHATFLNVPVVFANRVGYEDGVCFWGGSEVVDASGRTTAEACELEPGMIVAEVDPRETRRQRILAPLARDERLDLTIAELERIRRERYEH
jgi:NAD+ synthase (glutamine-hydrolysing)